MVEIHGEVEDGFAAVADAFVENFEQRGELGAACSLFVEGRQVVDLWAGTANSATQEPWTSDTMALVFSATKGATAICIGMLVERGMLDYDAPVAAYWSEFAAAGKEAVTVSQLMSHQAGLIFADPPLGLKEVLAVDPVVEALAAQLPRWEPGSMHGYHALTYGWLAGELVRRVDGRRIGRFFADEVAAPLGLDFWIGLPEAEECRVAVLRGAPRPEGDELEQRAGHRSAHEAAVQRADVLVPTIADTIDAALIAVAGEQLRLYEAMTSTDEMRLPPQQDIEAASDDFGDGQAR